MVCTAQRILKTIRRYLSSAVRYIHEVIYLATHSNARQQTLCSKRMHFWGTTTTTNKKQEEKNLKSRNLRVRTVHIHIYHYVRKSDAWLLWCDHMQRFRIWSFASETERDGGPRRPVTSFIFVALVSVLSSSSWLLIFNVGRASNRLVHRSSTVNWAIHFLSTCLIARALKGKSKWSTVAL